MTNGSIKSTVIEDDSRFKSQDDRKRQTYLALGRSLPLGSATTTGSICARTEIHPHSCLVSSFDECFCLVSIDQFDIQLDISGAPPFAFTPQLPTKDHTHGV